MKDHFKVPLTRAQINTLRYAVEGYSARVVLEMSSGKRDPEQSKALLKDLSDIGRKLYYTLIDVDNKGGNV